MLRYALLFLIVAIVAGAFGLSGVAGAATDIAWILVLVSLVAAVVFFLTGRGPVCADRGGGRPTHEPRALAE
ncbi:DUF1328 domain-containing protein [Thiorhodococcus minor]|uniref:UPF0391 membrane protein G3446_05725 n=1 Tax=Thiorhodococcus minor TaxID=57489 RepID=A0A6M0JV28_9GAMM|nr:DUF1328 domain-containing protein [Thiorhodococcus minor]NEV61398.1 DUF1328 domain-containing protein [Thiorhodococcus minor]